MKHIRIGKDISMRWAITTDGASIPLQGRDLTLELKSPIGKVISIPYRIEGNVLTMTYYGYEQTVVGEYSLTLWENKGKPGQNVVDAIRAFKLVRTSPEEADFIGGDLQVESVDLGTENFDILTEGGYRGINIDTLQAEALENSVNINGKTYGNESFAITLPKANLDKAGVMGAADVRTLQEHGESIEQMNTSLQGHQSAINSLNTTMDRHSESISQISTTLDEHGESISRLDSTTREHSNSIAQIKTKLGEHTESISELKSSSDLHDTNIDAIKAQVDSQGKSIGSIEGKLAEHSESISQASIAIEENSSSIADIRAKHNSDVDAINDILDEHTQSINATSDVVSGHTIDITSIKSNQTEHNNRLADHEERLVYTESDLLKVREEYNSIISDLRKSIWQTQKAFVVETNDKEGYIYIDGVKKIIPANSIKGFMFQHGFNNGNSGIASFRFLVTNTSSVTNMRSMFYGCDSLASLDISSFDTSSVTNMIAMFSGCNSLVSLDISSFDTSSVTDMGCMFENCGHLKSLDISSFDTSSVTNMGSMFYGCDSLASLDISSFDTSAVKNMRYMFSGCNSLVSLDVSGFDTSSVTDIGGMFENCGHLKSLDISSFDTSSVTNMSVMFTNCSSLTSLDLSKFNTSAVKNMYAMFSRCLSLTSLLLGQNFFKTSAVTTIDFSSCSKWTNETVVTSLVTNSYDRAAAGLNTLTLKLHANTKAALTDEQKATITAKGYTIA